MEKEFFFPPNELLTEKDAYFMNEALKEVEKVFYMLKFPKK